MFFSGSGVTCTGNASEKTARPLASWVVMCRDTGPKGQSSDAGAAGGAPDDDIFA